MHFAWLPNARRFIALVITMMEDAKKAPIKSDMIVMCGLSRIGKTTYVEKYYKNYYRIDSLRIHETINTLFKFLQDDRTVNGPAYMQRQLLTYLIRELVMKYALRHGRAIVCDSVNGTKELRQKLIELGEKAGYMIEIIYIRRTNRNLFLDILKQQDQEKILQGREPAWRELFDKQEQSFEPPTEDEGVVITKNISSIEEI